MNWLIILFFFLFKDFINAYFVRAYSYINASGDYKTSNN